MKKPGTARLVPIKFNKNLKSIKKTWDSTSSYFSYSSKIHEKIQDFHEKTHKNNVKTHKNSQYESKNTRTLRLVLQPIL
jgi:S-adenosylmethionine synthetase